MACAKPFVSAQHCRQRLAHRRGAVKHLGRFVAQVAGAAGHFGFAKIPQQRLAATLQRLGQTQQRVQPPVVGGAAFGRGQPLVNLRTAQFDVIGSEQGQGFGRGTVTARAADFLIIGLDAFGQVGVGDPADVGLVDAHAKGDSGDNDQPVLLLEPAFGDAAVFGVHTAVIMDRAMACVAQRLRQRFGLGPRAAIDDARLSLARGGKVQDLRARPVLGGKGQMDVGPVKAAQKGARRFPVEQFLHDLGLGFDVGGRCKRCQRHVQGAAQFADAQVVGAEIMAPLADAMRLVHGDHRHADAAQHAHGRPRGQPFGRHIQQLQLAALQRLPDGIRLFRSVARGQRTRGHPRLLQRAHLVAHQRDQRRDHHSNPVAHQRRQLETQGFTATRGHDGQHVFTVRHGVHDLFLPGAESVKAEYIGQ